MHTALILVLILVVLLLLAVVAVSYAQSWFYHLYQHDVAASFNTTTNLNDILTEGDIARLPEPVKHYLRYTQCIGKPRVKNFKIKFSGKLRANAESPWMPFTSEQYNFITLSNRLFFMKAVIKGLPVAGYHCFKNGVAYMDIRLFSLFRVQHQKGQAMNEAETVTFFNDMCCMAPATLIDTRIKWLAVDGNTVMASFTNNNITISALLYFNNNGQLINFISNDRYAANAGKKLQWATPLSNYKILNGYMLPMQAETIYTYPEGDVCYGQFKVTGVQYNLHHL